MHDSSDPEHEGGADESPQVFLLSGWGEPGSALAEDDDAPENSTDRRFWTCWCATHRPPPSKKLGSTAGSLSGSSQSSTIPRALIVLELELERDMYNPLYPPFPREMQLSGGSSPGTSVSPGGSNRSSDLNVDGSGSTTTSTIMGRNSDSGNATEMPFSHRAPSVADLGTDSAQTRNSTGDPSPVSPINPAEIFLSSKQGLPGDDDWFPKPEDVFESTTSHSKPLKALERMRRVSRPGSERSTRYTPKSARERARARRGGGQAGVGTMDIFAVLAQVNDQLSSAADLDSFLKIVAGVIKDLTQFHRVLVYQFDDQWNGQVVAELVDWRQTHDLYKGLHFPASDIPVQVMFFLHVEVSVAELYLSGTRVVQNKSVSLCALCIYSNH